jgi:filamentous hemagglutinin family protein
MKNGPRLKAVALASGASILASFGIGKAIEKIAPAPQPSGAVAANQVTSAAASRIAGGVNGAGPSTLLVIKRDDDRTYVVAQPPPASTYVQAPVQAPAAPAPAPVTRTS